MFGRVVIPFMIPELEEDYHLMYYDKYFYAF